MKFNCGPSKEVRRKAALKKHNMWIAERTIKLRNWHNFFAWFPVRVGEDDCRWMEWVMRKKDVEVKRAGNALAFSLDLSYVDDAELRLRAKQSTRHLHIKVGKAEYKPREG